jgi:hypothetical protein
MYSLNIDPLDPSVFLRMYLTAQRISKRKLKQTLLSDVFWSSIRLNSSATGTGTGASQQFAHYSAHAHTAKLESRCWICNFVHHGAIVINVKMQASKTGRSEPVKNESHCVTVVKP